LLFWLSSLSMSVFGATNLGYKLPTILAALAAVFSTYRFALVFYEKSTAQLAAVILATSQSLFLTTNDCRTDTVLMACVAFAFWQLAAAFQTDSKKHFFLGFVGIGLGMLAKGPVALVIPILGFGTHFLLKKQWKNLLRFDYLWGLLVIGIVLLPMCWGLYQQFDVQPDKVVNGQKGTSGLRFFFWTQSFGRITGENHWRNAVYFTYLMESMFWSFAPWILLLWGGFLARWAAFLPFLREKMPSFHNKEYITLGGLTLGYISMATSQYQLPHYVFVIYPLAAVITADFIHTYFNAKTTPILPKILRGVHWFAMVALWAFPFLILTYSFPNQGLPMVVMGILAVGTLVFMLKTKQLVLSTALTTLCINVFLNLYFYPKLLTYQMGNEVGRYVRTLQNVDNQFFTYKNGAPNALHFYSRRIVPHKSTLAEIKGGDLLLVQNEGWEDLQKALQSDAKNAAWDSVTVVKTGVHFSVSNLTTRLVNAQTREAELQRYFLVRVH
jgi:4-amino-4-deoxy-L-arabinose transferase-like glycosyltransferase